MEDLSIEELMSALQTTQEEKSVARLNERNVVELINKLQKVGLLGDGLLHSIDGREYLTPEHLRQEILGAVEESGGRVAMVDLPAVLGVDLIHCEKQAQLAIESSNGSLQRIQGDLITLSYFDSLATEVNETLKEAGVVSISNLARQFALAGDLVQSIIAARIGTLVQGRLESGLIFTPAYIARIKAQLRGALRGCCVPVQIASLKKSLELGGTSPAAQMVTPIVEELAAEGAIQGQLRGGATSWVPAIYLRRQQESIVSFYKQNSYVGYDTVSKLGVTNARAHLEGLFPEGIPLQTAFVATSLIEQLDAAVEDAFDSNSWVDCLSLAPSVLSPADAADLLARCPSVKALGSKAQGADKGQLLAESCVVSSAFLEELRQCSLANARTAAEEALKQRMSSSASAATSTTEPGKQSASQKKAAVEDDNNSDEDWSRGSKAAKGKKGAKVKKGGGKGGPPPGGAKAAAAKSGAAAPPQLQAAGRGKAAAAATNAATAARLLSLEALTKKVVEWLPEVEGAGVDEGLPEALAAIVRPAALVEYEKTLTAVFNAGAEARRRRREAMVKGLQESFERLQLYTDGIKAFDEDEATAQILHKHLLKGLGAESVDFLLLYQEAEQEDALERSGEAPHTLTAADRTALLKQLPSDTVKAATSAVEALNSANAQDLVRAVEEAASAAGVRLRPLDKKAEKAALQVQRQALQANLSQESDPAVALSLAVPLLVMQVHGCAVSVPGRALSGVIEGLKGGLSEETYDLLFNFHADVVNMLKSGDGAQSAQLQEKLPLLVAAALGQKVQTAGEPTRAEDVEKQDQVEQ
ncbi:E3 UFM1-protein ligase 1 homolog [Coccomyxa sp. Obi]|nr:E3 UFM1-protein ligase 1 homolog [Coccomyxa sp. Obi]